MIFLSSQKRFTYSFIIIPGIILFFGCQKDPANDNGSGTNPTSKPDLTTKVTSSGVSGFVTDQNDLAVKSASVEVGGITTITDKYGYFEVRNVQVVQDAAIVTILKTGYFKAVKTYIATNGKNAFLRIKLLPKVTVGNINAATGGNVILTNGLTISFPAGVAVNAGTNAAYSGSINVAAQLISATDANLNRIMPGDLRGITSDNNIRILTTYGMVAVELTGSSGERLQIAPGKKATLTIPIPAALQASAPASIPLWNFDESVGLWKEDGAAVKTGNTYVGEVSHFSDWNCAVPGNYVKLNFTLVNQNGEALQNVLVKISATGQGAFAVYAFTDSAGYTGGPAPSNAELKMEVFNNNCAVYTKTFSSTGTDLSLGTITVNTQTFQATVTGTVTNCANMPVTNGYIILTGDHSYRYPISNGTFNFNYMLCPAANVKILAEDINNSQQSNSKTYSLNSGNNAIGNIQACSTSTQQFVNYTINDTLYRFTPPADTLEFENLGGWGVITGSNTTPVGTLVYINFDARSIVAGNTHQLYSFNRNPPYDSFSIITPPIGVMITEYGAPGQFIAGTFTGTFRGKHPANRLYNITFSFRIRRWK